MKRQAYKQILWMCNGLTAVLTCMTLNTLRAKFAHLLLLLRLLTHAGHVLPLSLVAVMHNTTMAWSESSLSNQSNIIMFFKNSVCLSRFWSLHIYLQNLYLQTYFPSYRPTLSLPTSLTKFEVGVEIPVRIYYYYIIYNFGSIFFM
jgi:hypothetical protein